MQERPDLTGVPENVVAYIEYLESMLPKKKSRADVDPIREPSEPPTTINLITLSAQGLIKRTPRHHYSRQNRGGMGVFDIELAEDDFARQMLFCDETEPLYVLTSFGRIFLLPLSKIDESPVRAKGTRLTSYLSLHDKETVVTLLAGTGESVSVLTTAGYVVNRNRHYLKNGAILYDIGSVGRPLSISWSHPDHDIFVATRNGLGIRFSYKQVHQNGSLAMRLDDGDQLLGITSVPVNGQVLLVTGDGKGTLRLMQGFRPNKSPGAGGKVAIKSDQLIGAIATPEEADIFIISQLGKLIRFSAADIPSKTGVVQGVNCIALRSDEVTAFAISSAG